MFHVDATVGVVSAVLVVDVYIDVVVAVAIVRAVPRWMAVQELRDAGAVDVDVYVDSDGQGSLQSAGEEDRLELHFRNAC